MKLIDLIITHNCRPLHHLSVEKINLIIPNELVNMAIAIRLNPILRNNQFIKL